MVDRQLLTSVLRTSGRDGEQLLLQLMRYHKDEKVRNAAVSVLSYRLPKDELTLFARIQLCNVDMDIYD